MKIETYTTVIVGSLGMIVISAILGNVLESNEI